MDDIESLFKTVEERVKERQEHDRWEAIASKEFPILCDRLMNRLETILYPIQARLQKYSKPSVHAVWETIRQEHEFSIRLGDRNLTFRPIGAEAEQKGDRFTVQVLRNDDALVLRFITMYSHAGDMQLGIINHTSMPETLNDRQLIQLLCDELLER